MKYILVSFALFSAVAFSSPVMAQSVGAELQVCPAVNAPTPSEGCTMKEYKDENGCITGYQEICESKTPNIFVRFWNWLTSLFTGRK